MKFIAALAIFATAASAVTISLPSGVSIPSGVTLPSGVTVISAQPTATETVAAGAGKVKAKRQTKAFGARQINIPGLTQSSSTAAAGANRAAATKKAKAA